MGDHREGEVLATGDRAASATVCGSGLARGTALTAAGSQDDGEEPAASAAPSLRILVIERSALG
jgi:hypothetical protein